MSESVTLPLPPLANRYWRLGRGHLYRSHEATLYQQTVRVLATRKPVAGPVALDIMVYRKRRAGDIDGYVKVLLDALQGVLYENDRQVVELHVRLGSVDPANPRVEVTCSSDVHKEGTLVP